MSRLRLLDKSAEEETVEPQLASTVVEELTDVLEKADRPGPTTGPEGVYWHYSVPMAGVRYYGFPEPRSTRK